MTLFSNFFIFSFIIFLGRYIGLLYLKEIVFYIFILNLINSVYIFIHTCILNYNIIIYIKNYYILFDQLSCIMLLLIIIVSFIVHLYSFNYMKNESFIIKFISYLSLFTFFMIILVTSNNIFQLFFGWEGVGICSFLLISYWNSRIEAIKSSMKAIMINKIGDIFFILLIIIIWKKYGEINFIVLESNFSNNCFLIGFFIIIASTSKSAQFGLHTWLADAMEGPTPVSALIHAATMVTAGIFLIIRLSFLIEYNSLILLIIFLLGSITTIFSSLISIMQNDFKKVIAYSTCSQLGYMMMICGLSQYSLSIFHLLNHGFFKALLFLSAGIIIHNILDEQDFRKSGNLININKINFILLINSSLVLAGLPYLSGYYSKDLIIEISSINSISILGIYFCVLATLFTSIYSFKMIYISFIKNDKTPFINKNIINESNFKIYKYLIYLFIFSVIIGYIFKNIIFLEYIPFIHKSIKFYPFYFSYIGIFLGLKIINNNFFLKNRFFNFITLLWSFNEIINIISYYIYNLMNIIFIRLDQQIIEWIGPYWFKNLINHINFINFYQRGILSNYLILIIFILL